MACRSALVDAFRLKRQVAKFPRIVITRTVAADGQAFGHQEHTTGTRSISTADLSRRAMARFLFTFFAINPDKHKTWRAASASTKADPWSSRLRPGADGMQTRLWRAMSIIHDGFRRGRVVVGFGLSTSISSGRLGSYHCSTAMGGPRPQSSVAWVERRRTPADSLSHDDHCGYGRGIPEDRDLHNLQGVTCTSKHPRTARTAPGQPQLYFEAGADTLESHEIAVRETSLIGAPMTGGASEWLQYIEAAQSDLQAILRVDPSKYRKSSIKARICEVSPISRLQRTDIGATDARTTRMRYSRTSDARCIRAHQGSRHGWFHNAAQRSSTPSTQEIRRSRNKSTHRGVARNRAWASESASIPADALHRACSRAEP